MEEKKLKVHGVPEPKGTAWLKEVRIDAARNTVETLRRQAEKNEFEEAKARGITPQEVIAKGKEDLEKVDPNFGQLNDGGFDYDFEEEKADNEEVEELKKQLKAAKAAQTRAENKLKAQVEVKEPEEVEPVTETKEEETK